MSSGFNMRSSKIRKYLYVNINFIKYAVNGKQKLEIGFPLNAFFNFQHKNVNQK